MEERNKINKNGLAIYSVIVLQLTIITNYYTLIYITNEFTGNITFYLNQYIILYTIRPVVFPPLLKFLSMFLMVNLFFLLIVEFGLIWLLHKRLNRFFRIEKLFTAKKITLLASVIIYIQLIISCWLWQIDSQNGNIYPMEEEFILDDNMFIDSPIDSISLKSSNY